MAKKRILGTRALFEETEAVAKVLAQQREHLQRDIPIARLVPSRYNSRQSYSRAALDELVRSIHEHGFIGSLDGRELPDGRVELAYGSRRLLAARHAGLLALPVTLHRWTDAQMCFISLAENLAREGLSEADEAAMVRQLRDDLHLAETTIADSTGKPATWVKERTAAADAPPEPVDDPDAAKLDDVVASLIGDRAHPDPSSSVYGLDVARDAATGSLAGSETSPLRQWTAQPESEPANGWVETGSTMLVLASDALQAFDPSQVPDSGVDQARDLLERLEEQATRFRRELEGRR